MSVFGQTSVAAVILAAGRGRRFAAADGRSKLVQSFDGTPIVRLAAAAALASRAVPIVVVTGHAAHEVRTALAGLPLELVHNPHHETGMASSLATGLAALPLQSAGALVVLADMPLVAASTLDALIACFERAPGRPDAVVPSFGGRRGNPVLIARTLFAEVTALDRDEGARRLLAEPGREVLECPVQDGGIGIDVDTPEALAGLRRTS